MRFLSCFSGIGGIEKGLEDAGWECVGQVEFDAACRHWLGVHWPHVHKWTDIRTLTGDAVRDVVGTVDAIVGGPPCQPASVAGKRQGSADDRWLWPDYLRLVGELSPKWVLAENPTGIVTLRPHGLDWIMQRLEEEGYQPFTVNMGADDVGAPHRRKRVWIVGRLRLADADANGVREQRGRAGGDRAAAAVALGGGEALADASRDAVRQRPDGGADRERTRAGGHEALAHASSGGQRADGPPSRDAGHPDGSEPLVGESTGERLEGLGSDAGEPQEPQPRHASPLRWPARPGERQHDWEAPRLAHTTKQRREGRGVGSTAWDGPEPQVETGAGRSDGVADSPSEPTRRAGLPRQEPDTGEPEFPVGPSAHGLSGGLAGFTSAHRREALKACGNSVVPPLVAAIGRAIMRMERES